MKIEGRVILAEEGKAIRRKGESEKTTVTRVHLSRNDRKENWEDCEYGEPSMQDETTESDKDADPHHFGVEV